MTYSSGQRILASDYNTFLASVSSVYGIGNGDSGYGQTAVNQDPISIGDPVRAAEWTALRTMMVVCATHQGTSTSGLISSPSVGGPVSASAAMTTIVQNLTTNRLTASSAGMTLTNAAHTVTRSSTWSTTIDTTVDVIFASEDAARFFFNSGGELRIRFGHPNGTSGQDDVWRTIFGSSIGTITMTARDARRSGSQGAASGLGYYELFDAAQPIYTGTNIGGIYSATYSTNDVNVTARRLNFTGIRGGNGTGIRFQITMSDEYTSAFGDSVSAGTFVTFDHFRSTYLTGISAPTFSTIDAL